MANLNYPIKQVELEPLADGRKMVFEMPSTRISIRACFDDWADDVTPEQTADFRQLLIDDILDIFADINGGDTPTCLMNDLRNGSRSCSCAQSSKGHCWSFPRDFTKYDMLDLARDLGFTVNGNQITV